MTESWYEKISSYDAIRFASDVDTVDIETQFAEFDAFGEDEVDQIADIIGGIEASGSAHGVLVVFDHK